MAPRLLLCLVALSPTLAAPSFQPTANVTRGVYASADQAVRAAVWLPFGSGFTFDADRPHGGRACARVENAGGPGTGQGVSQRVDLGQTEPKPIRIAGWSRAKDVGGPKAWTYSLYVDFTYADGSSWPMQLATFEPGTHDWQYAETVVTPAKPVARASVHAFVRNVAGTAWFDDLFVGEVGGPNRLRCAGFEEGERTDASGQRELFDTLRDLHADAAHIYLWGGASLWDEPKPESTDLWRFLATARDRRIGVWLTLSPIEHALKDANDPAFPQYDCVNGAWGREWTELLAKAARYPFAGLSMVPDEYNWNHWGLAERYRKHPDAKVRAFYEQLGTYCTCPDCQRRFKQATGQDLPAWAGSRPVVADASTRAWLKFRYDSTTDWLARSVKAVKAVNPGLRADSLICVTPVCSDFWYGPGIAWDRAGYEAGLEYPTTDPYILLHNYLGDSTHWYVTETTEHLAAATPQRRCGVVLEASRLRPDSREQDPVERYGSALSAVWHGARELAFFHLDCLTGRNQLAADAKLSYRGVQDVYDLLERIDPWLTGARPAPGVAVLFSRASCDAWRLNAEAKPPNTAALTHLSTDARYAALAQNEVIEFLFRQGYPMRVFYLDTVRPEELASFPVVVVPFPYAIADDRVALLKGLGAAGKRVVVVSETGTLDEDGTPRAKPALADLLGLTGPAADELAPDAQPGPKAHPATGIEFLAGSYGVRLPKDHTNEHRGTQTRILPPTLDPAIVRVWRDTLNHSVRPLLSRDVDGDDAEVAELLDPQGRHLVLLINWRAEPVTVPLPAVKPYTLATSEGYRIGPDQRVTAWAKPLGPVVRLEGQQAVVMRLPKG